MTQILKSNNNYYIKEKTVFYGLFYSVADAEEYLEGCRDFKHRLNSLSNYKIIKNIINKEDFV